MMSDDVKTATSGNDRLRISDCELLFHENVTEVHGSGHCRQQTCRNKERIVFFMSMSDANAIMEASSMEN